MGAWILESALICIGPSFSEIGLRWGMRDSYGLLFKLENQAKWDLLSIQELMEIRHTLATSDLFKRLCYRITTSVVWVYEPTMHFFLSPATRLWIHESGKTRLMALVTRKEKPELALPLPQFNAQHSIWCTVCWENKVHVLSFPLWISVNTWRCLKDLLIQFPFLEPSGSNSVYLFGVHQSPLHVHIRKSQLINGLGKIPVEIYNFTIVVGFLLGAN